MHWRSYLKRDSRAYPQGLTAALVPTLTREHVFEALRERRTYATTCRRILLDTRWSGERCFLAAASEDGIEAVTRVVNGLDTEHYRPHGDPRIVERRSVAVPLADADYCYFRVSTTQGDLAWSSPV